MMQLREQLFLVLVEVVAFVQELWRTPKIFTVLASGTSRSKKGLQYNKSFQGLCQWTPKGGLTAVTSSTSRPPASISMCSRTIVRQLQSSKLKRQYKIGVLPKCLDKPLIVSYRSWFLKTKFFYNSFCVDDSVTLKYNYVNIV